MGSINLTRSKIYLLLGWTAAATGFCFLLLAIGFATNEQLFLMHAIKAQGTVIANIERYTVANIQTGVAAQTDYCPQFGYQSVDGVTHVVTSPACSNHPSFKMGDPIEIYYSRSNYGNAQTHSFGARWGLVLGFGLVAILLAPIGFVLLRRLRLRGHPVDLFTFWA